MAKEKAEKVQAEVNEFLALNEGERLDALSKVRKAFEELDSYPDRIEANARRVKLLELWNKLINMRGADVVTTDSETADGEVQAEVQPIDDLNEQSNEIHPAPSAELLEMVNEDDHEKGKAVSFAEQNEEPHETIAQSFPELLHQVKVEGLPEDSSPSRGGVSAEGFIGPLPQKALDPSQEIELERVRLKLTKTGLLHDTVLPAGTIIAVIPVDAHHILESGMADYATASD